MDHNVKSGLFTSINIFLDMLHYYNEFHNNTLVTYTGNRANCMRNVGGQHL